MSAQRPSRGLVLFLALLPAFPQEWMSLRNLIQRIPPGFP